MKSLGSPPKVRLLYLIFFVSGASALVFETLWFRQAGLVFGNTVWAATTVLAAFMAGLALGNAIAAKWAGRLTRPVRTYALLELLVAAGGALVVIALPLLPDLFAPVSRALADLPGALHGVRFGAAFALLVLPATAMGMTLPVLVQALSRDARDYGGVLGRLYGWNALGAVFGALAAELLLVRALGIRGSGLAAAGLNLCAAAAALWIGRGITAAAAEPAVRGAPRAGAALLSAGFLCGGLLLALEVVWFRILLLRVSGTALEFAVMLAVVLAGIAVGGLIGGLLLRRDLEVARVLPAAALAGGVAVGLGYVLLPTGWLPPETETSRALLRVAAPTLILTFPASVVSGLLFALIGARLAERVGLRTAATGWLVLSNTVGAATGAAVAGFVLLPALGMERSLQLLAVGYALVAVCVASRAARPGWPVAGVAGAVLLLAAVVLPMGRMQVHLDTATHPYRIRDGSHTVYTREGLNETLQVLRTDLLGEPLRFRLVTNRFSMSGTVIGAQRYMKLYVYWPRVLAQELESALLISYGVGNTARALVETPELRRITVVDTSREILELSAVLHPEHRDPLRDPRVEARIEDGRHFLQTSRRRFDLITAEPPPPRVAGVVSLYTREYFSLLRRALNPQGVVTYWLPVNQLTPKASRAILRAFCDAFPDCSLWAGSRYNWMLVGSNGLERGPTAEAFERLWSSEETGRELAAIGLEHPGQLGATFIADAGQIAGWIGDAPPLTDDFPLRLDGALASEEDLAFYRDWMAAPEARRRFAASEWVRRIWPERVRADTLPFFDEQTLLNDTRVAGPDAILPLLDHYLRATTLRAPVLWLLGSGASEQRIVAEQVARTGIRPESAWHLGAGALAERRPRAAAGYFADALEADPRAASLWAYSLCRAGLPERAAQVASAHADRVALPASLRCWDGASG